MECRSFLYVFLVTSIFEVNFDLFSKRSYNFYKFQVDSGSRKPNGKIWILWVFFLDHPVYILSESLFFKANGTPPLMGEVEWEVNFAFL